MAKLYFYYSAMNAGKTTSLLQSGYNYTERGMNVLYFNPEINTRHDTNKIVSRIGLSADAESFSQHTNFEQYVEKHIDNGRIDCILIDEGQFLSEAQVHELSNIVDYRDIPVLVYGLRTDFRGFLFAGSAILLAIADELQEIKTVCSCGRKAIMTARINSDGKIIKKGEQIDIGNNDRYVSLCRKHHKDKIMQRIILKN